MGIDVIFFIEIWKTKWTLSCLVNDTCTWNDGAYGHIVSIKLSFYRYNTAHVIVVDNFTLLYNVKLVQSVPISYSCIATSVCTKLVLFVIKVHLLYLIRRFMMVMTTRLIKKVRESTAIAMTCVKRLLRALWPWPLSCIFKVRKDKNRMCKNEEFEQWKTK